MECSFYESFLSSNELLFVLIMFFIYFNFTVNIHYCVAGKLCCS